MEIWSPRTSKRIVWFFSGICLLGIAYVFLLRYWLNPWERHAVEEVLKSAALVRQANSEDLQKQYDAAKLLQKVIERRAWTMRDEAIGTLASGTISMALICRRSELGLTKGVDPQVSSAIGKFGCSEYERLTQYSNAAIRTRLGF
jgi:hypothetical protein